MNYWTESKNNIYVAAHRGWSEAYPENTMEAFRAAVALGVDQLETDIRITGDGELVLIHDATVDRTTNGTGLVREKTLEELQRLDAGSHKGEAFAGARIPTFCEFMEYVKDISGITLDLELKEYPVPGWEETSYSVCDRVLAMVDEYGFSDRVVLNTFSGRLHEYIHETYGKKYRQHVYYPIHHLGECRTDPYAYAFCCCMFRDGEQKLNMPDKKAFDCMAERGVEPWAGASVKDEAGVDLAIANGATLITCNNPDQILQWLREKGVHQ